MEQYQTIMIIKLHMDINSDVMLRKWFIKAIVYNVFRILCKSAIRFGLRLCLNYILKQIM